jgi:hypothetical protein
MNKKIGSRKSSARQSARLGAYLAASLGASTAATSTADAAIVVIDIGPSGFNIGGVNGGVTAGTLSYISDFPFVGAGDLTIGNTLSPYDLLGLWGQNGLQFAFNGLPLTPRNFALNAPINGAASFTGQFNEAFFKVGVYESPDFGPGSYMGFQTATGNFGWLGVTWNGATDVFQIFSGAYEDVPGVAILAGDTGSAAVPEPGTWAAAALLAGGAAFLRWRKRRDEAQKEAA